MYILEKFKKLKFLNLKKQYTLILLTIAFSFNRILLKKQFKNSYEFNPCVFLNNQNVKTSKMNLFFLLLIFLYLSIRSDAKIKCRSYPFKTLLSPKNCGCNNITHSPMGRIFNGTTLDSRDLPYVASIYGFRIKSIWIRRPFNVEINLYCTGTIIGPKFVLTQVL